MARRYFDRDEFAAAAPVAHTAAPGRDRPRDGDGDGFVFDGTPRMRPFNPLTDLLGKVVKPETVEKAGRGDRWARSEVVKRTRANAALYRKRRQPLDPDRIVESTLGEQPTTSDRRRPAYDAAAELVRAEVAKMAPTVEGIGGVHDRGMIHRKRREAGLEPLPDAPQADKDWWALHQPIRERVREKLGGPSKNPGRVYVERLEGGAPDPAGPPGPRRDVRRDVEPAGPGWRDGRPTDEQLMEAFTADLGDGYAVEAIRTDGDGLVEGIILAEGIEVGSFKRRVAENAPVVEFESLKLHRDHQGNGVGHRLFAQQVEAMRGLGAERIDVYASSWQSNGVLPGEPQNGAYTWARFGYDWAPGSTSHVLLARDLESMSARGVGSPADRAAADDMAARLRQVDAIPTNPAELPDDFPTPNDVAMLGWTPDAESWFGRDLMSGRADPGRRVGFYGSYLLTDQPSPDLPPSRMAEPPPDPDLPRGPDLSGMRDATPDQVRDAAKAAGGPIMARAADNRRSRSGILRGDAVQVEYVNDDWARVRNVQANGRTRAYRVRWDRFNGIDTTANEPPATYTDSPDDIRAAAKAAGAAMIRARIGDSTLKSVGVRAGDVLDVEYGSDLHARIRVTRRGRVRAYNVPWERLDGIDRTDRPAPEVDTEGQLPFDAPPAVDVTPDVPPVPDVVPEPDVPEAPETPGGPDPQVERFQLADWETIQPWNVERDPADPSRLLLNGQPAPEWLKFSPARGTEAASHTDDAILLKPEFFNLPGGPDVRRSALYHEAGHGLSDRMLEDGSAWDLVDGLPEFGHLNGQTTPGEMAAEGYSILWSDPEYLDRNAPAIRDALVAKAVEYGYPLPEGIDRPADAPGPDVDVTPEPEVPETPDAPRLADDPLSADWPLRDPLPNGYQEPVNTVTLPNGRRVTFESRAYGTSDRVQSAGSFAVRDTDTGAEMGRIEFSVVTDREPRSFHIDYITANPDFARQGVATALLARALAEHDGTVDPGMLTDDGARWWPTVRDRVDARWGITGADDRDPADVPGTPEWRAANLDPVNADVADAWTTFRDDPQRLIDALDRQLPVLEAWKAELDANPDSFYSEELEVDGLIENNRYSRETAVERLTELDAETAIPDGPDPGDVRGNAQRGRVSARIADRGLVPLGIKQGDQVDVEYLDDDQARVFARTRSGRVRAYDVSWDRLGGPVGDPEGLEVTPDEPDAPRPVVAPPVDDVPVAPDMPEAPEPVAPEPGPVTPDAPDAPETTPDPPPDATPPEPAAIEPGSTPDLLRAKARDATEGGKQARGRVWTDDLGHFGFKRGNNVYVEYVDENTARISKGKGKKGKRREVPWSALTTPKERERAVQGTIRERAERIAEQQGVPVEVAEQAIRDLPDLRAGVIADIDAAADDAFAQINMADGAALAPPPKKKWGLLATGGEGWINPAGSTYEWFFEGLSPREQARVRRNWLTGTMSPDQFAQQASETMENLDYDEVMEWWLRHTRMIDAAAAIRRGKLPSHADQVDLDGSAESIRDEDFTVYDLFGRNPDDAAAIIATRRYAQEREEREESALRQLGDSVRGETGERPWELGRDEWMERVSALEYRIDQEAGVSDAEWDDYDFLAPPDLRDGGDLEDVWQRIRDTARDAGYDVPRDPTAPEYEGPMPDVEPGPEALPPPVDIDAPAPPAVATDSEAVATLREQVDAARAAGDKADEASKMRQLAAQLRKDAPADDQARLDEMFAEAAQLDEEAKRVDPPRARTGERRRAPEPEPPVDFEAERKRLIERMNFASGGNDYTGEAEAAQALVDLLERQWAAETDDDKRFETRRMIDVFETRVRTASEKAARQPATPDAELRSYTFAGYEVNTDNVAEFMPALDSDDFRAFQSELAKAAREARESDVDTPERADLLYLVSAVMAAQAAETDDEAAADRLWRQAELYQQFSRETTARLTFDERVASAGERHPEPITAAVPDELDDPPYDLAPPPRVPHEMTSKLSPSFVDPERVDAMVETFRAAPESLRIKVPAGAVAAVLADGRIKSQFETGSSVGTYNPAMRRNSEGDLHGIPDDVDDTARPVYGYVDDGVSGNEAAPYGAIGFHVQPRVAGRTTITFGDSLTHPGRAVRLTDEVTPTDLAAASNSFFARGAVRNESYTEAQFHGGLSLDDLGDTVDFQPLDFKWDTAGDLVLDDFDALAEVLRSGRFTAVQVRNPARDPDIAPDSPVPGNRMRYDGYVKALRDVAAANPGVRIELTRADGTVDVIGEGVARNVVETPDGPPGPRRDVVRDATTTPDAWPDGAPTSETITAAFTGDLGDGYAMEADYATDTFVSGDIMFDGESVGRFERSIDRVKPVVKFDSIRIDEEHQGKGVGSRFFAATVESLRALGVAEIHTDALTEERGAADRNWNGAYTWARMGYDWKPGTETHTSIANALVIATLDPDFPEALKDEARALADRLGHPRGSRPIAVLPPVLPSDPDRLPEDFPTPNDVAMLGWTPGATDWPGKRLLSGGYKDAGYVRWEGVYRLDPAPVVNGVESADDDYRGLHRPSYGPGLHEIDNGELLPPDVLQHPEWYTGYTEPEFIRETVQALRRANGDPDATVTIYRAAPPGVDRINNGDWVTLSRSYAEQHGYQEAEDGSDDWPVIEMQVPASEVRFAGDDLMEWGWWPAGDPDGDADAGGAVVAAMPDPLLAVVDLMMPPRRDTPGVAG